MTTSVLFWPLMDDAVEAVPLLIVAMEGGLHGHDGIRRWWENWFNVFPDWNIEVVVCATLETFLTALRALGHGAGPPPRKRPTLQDTI